VKDVAQGVAQDVAQNVAQGVVTDVAQDVAEGVLSAAEGGSVMVLILSIAIFQRRNPRPTHACRSPRLPLGDTWRTST